MSSPSYWNKEIYNCYYAPKKHQSASEKMLLSGAVSRKFLKSHLQRILHLNNDSFMIMIGCGGKKENNLERSRK